MNVPLWEILVSTAWHALVLEQAPRQFGDLQSACIQNGHNVPIYPTLFYARKGKQQTIRLCE